MVLLRLRDMRAGVTTVDGPRQSPANVMAPGDGGISRSRVEIVPFHLGNAQATIAIEGADDRNAADWLSSCSLCTDVRRGEHQFHCENVFSSGSVRIECQSPAFITRLRCHNTRSHHGGFISRPTAPFVVSRR